MNLENDKTSSQAQMFANRLQKRFCHLKKWAQRTGVDAFRLYDRDIPEIPLVLDYYGDSALPQEAAVSGALYKRPYEKDDAEEEKWLSVMKDSAASALGIAPQRIFIKQRQRQRGTNQYEKTGDKLFEKIVGEGDLSFKVNLSGYLDTGLFPDRRLLRVMVRQEAAGKRVLNLFSYTGSFSVYAAAGGALSTDSVDLSNTYLEWARENFSLNGFSAQMIARQYESFGSRKSHKLIRADALDFIKKATALKRRWDIIVLDPPAFSNSKKMTGIFDLQRDKIPLVRSCLELLASGGKMFLSINTQKQQKNTANVVLDLGNVSDKLRVTDIGKKITDEDFKGRKMPLAFMFTQ